MGATYVQDGQRVIRPDSEESNFEGAFRLPLASEASRRAKKPRTSSAAPLKRGHVDVVNKFLLGRFPFAGEIELAFRFVEPDSKDTRPWLGHVAPMLADAGIAPGLVPCTRVSEQVVFCGVFVWLQLTLDGSAFWPQRKGAFLQGSPSPHMLVDVTLFHGSFPIEARSNQCSSLVCDVQDSIILHHVVAGFELALHGSFRG